MGAGPITTPARSGSSPGRVNHKRRMKMEIKIESWIDNGMAVVEVSGGRCIGCIGFYDNRPVGAGMINPGGRAAAMSDAAEWIREAGGDPADFARELDAIPHAEDERIPTA